MGGAQLYVLHHAAKGTTQSMEEQKAFELLEHNDKQGDSKVHESTAVSKHVCVGEPQTGPVFRCFMGVAKLLELYHVACELR